MCQQVTGTVEAIDHVSTDTCPIEAATRPSTLMVPPLRLVGPTGAPLVARQLMGLRLSAVWALMVAFDRPVPAPFEGLTWKELAT